MRQRLLLIAGWAVAAVGSSVVASGAVAVAGGQVTDRPLRLLSASEVEAIPIVNTLAARAPTTSSLPPEARDTPGSPGGVGTDAASETLADRQSSAGDEGEPGSRPGTGLLPEDDTVPTTAAAPADDPGGVIDQGDPVAGDPVSVRDPEDDPIVALPVDPPGEPATDTQVYTMVGGTVAVAGVDGRVELVSAIPRTGYTVTVNFDAVDALVVTFESATSESVLRAFWIDGGLVVEAPNQIS